MPTTCERPPAALSDAARSLAAENRALTFFAVKRWAGRLGLDFEVAVSEADLALCEAAAAYRPGAGAAFSNYALTLIRWRFLRARRLALRAGPLPLAEDGAGLPGREP